MSPNDIKVLLVDDHSVVRLGLRSLMERNQGINVCGEAENLSEAYRKVKELNPDIVLMDIKLPDGDGVNGCREVKKISPFVKVIVLTAYAEDSIVIEAIKAGADGYLLKNIDSKAIISAIRDTAKGIPILDPSVVGKVLNVVKREGGVENRFSAQERQILDLISEGKTNREISEQLYIAEKTVRNYVSKIMKKINVDNRTEAAIFWSKQKSLK